jgi:hypothetical protein
MELIDSFIRDGNILLRQVAVEKPPSLVFPSRENES